MSEYKRFITILTAWLTTVESDFDDLSFAKLPEIKINLMGYTVTIERIESHDKQ